MYYDVFGDVMLVNGKKMLSEARRKGHVIYHFNINNLEWAKIILTKCNELNTPVIIGVSEGAIRYMGGYHVVSSLIRSLILDLKINIDVSLHLDHGSSYDSCKKAIDAGFTSVMIDASKLSLDENILETKRVVDYAHANGVAVEAEVGAVGGIEDDKESGIAIANYDDCIRFVKETNIDMLAPAIGTVHGIYKGELNIDYDLISKLRNSLSIPLVMHGGSGLSNEILIKTINAGITKINVNSDIQDVWAKSVRKYINENPSVYDPRKIIYSGSGAMEEFIEGKINLLGKE